MKKIVFLTGGTGIMGMETIRKFMDHTDEFELRVLARPSEVNYEKLSQFGDNVKVIWGNLMDYDLVSSCMEGVDYVLHVGALINPLTSDWPPDITLRTNYGSTLAMLRGIKAYGQLETTRFVYIGTVEETGHHSIPHHWGRVGDPLQPSIYSYYALSKCASERAVAESGLKYWVSLRQCFMHPNNPVAAGYPIIGMTPHDNCSEHIDAESSGNLLVQICLNAPENLWRHAYNIGGGEGYRFTNYDLIKALHGNARNGYDPKWEATHNYHGQFYSDSDLLQELVPYRLKTSEEFLAEELKFQIKMVKSGPRLTPEEVKAKNKRICSKPGGTIWAVETDNEEAIRVYYGSREKYEAIPDSWDEIPIPEPDMTPSYMDHGFDETKPVSELDIEDMRRAAAFRGGKCLSDTMVKGDIYTPLRWQCPLGHEFTATPNLVLFLGHWCPDCMNGEWNYYEQARVNPFFAQSWDYMHENEEPFSVKMKCDARDIEKMFE